MSASREKKTRQELNSSGWADPKNAREAKQRKEEHRTNLLYGTIGVVFLLVAIVAVVWRTNIIPKTVTAATVNGEKYTAAEVNFYYENYYQNFLNRNYSILSMIGLDTGTSLKEQTISDTANSLLPAMGMPEAEDGQSWYDYMVDRALEQLSGVQALNDAAEAEGFTWTDDLQTQLDETMDSLSTTASSYGYTEQQYLGLIYGSTMTRSIYEEQTRRSLLATAYLQNYEDGLSYTTDELEAAYAEDPTAYDLVDCSYVRVSGAAPDTDEDGNAIEVTDEMTAEYMATAETTANAIYDAYQAGTSLEDAAAEYESTATYASSDSFTYSSSVLADWLYDDARQAGDTAVLESGTTYYVAVFHDRFREEYNSIDVRHILIQPATGTIASGEEGYEEEQEQLNADAKATAEELLQEWQNGDATEESFAALAMEHSTDGSKYDGGLYTKVIQGDMVDTFNDWCFDPARQPGDTGIVETQYGYHVMYFVGENIPAWQVGVSDTLASEDYNAWVESLTADASIEQGDFGLSFVAA